MGIVAYLVGLPLMYLARGASPLLRAPMGLFFLVCVIGGVVCVVLLSLRVYGPVLGVFLAVLSLIPLIGLFVLAFANARATKIMRDNRIRVGFFGADMAQFR